MQKVIRHLKNIALLIYFIILYFLNKTNSYILLNLIIILELILLFFLMPLTTFFANQYNKVFYLKAYLIRIIILIMARDISKLVYLGENLNQKIILILFWFIIPILFNRNLWIKK